VTRFRTPFCFLVLPMITSGLTSPGPDARMVPVRPAPWGRRGLPPLRTAASSGSHATLKISAILMPKHVRAARSGGRIRPRNGSARLPPSGLVLRHAVSP
jgi:hypothetical protein